MPFATLPPGSGNFPLGRIHYLNAQGFQRRLFLGGAVGALALSPSPDASRYDFCKLQFRGNWSSNCSDDARPP